MPGVEVPAAHKRDTVVTDVVADQVPELPNESEESLVEDSWSSEEEEEEEDSGAQQPPLVHMNPAPGTALLAAHHPEHAAAAEAPLSDSDDDSDTEILSSLPTYALVDLHVYRLVKDIAQLPPDTTYYLRNVRVLGVYEYSVFRPGHRSYSHYVRDRRSTHKLLLDCNETLKFPAPDSVVLLFGTIRHREVCVGQRIALMQYVLVRFWSYVLNVDQTELQLLAKAACLPAHIYKHTVPVDLDYLSDDADASISEGAGTSGTLVMDQTELAEDFYYAFDRLSNVQAPEPESSVD